MYLLSTVFALEFLVSEKLISDLLMLHEPRGEYSTLLFVTNECIAFSVSKETRQNLTIE